MVVQMVLRAHAKVCKRARVCASLCTGVLLPLRRVRTATLNTWSTSSSTGPTPPPRMHLETLPCTYVLYITRYVFLHHHLVRLLWPSVPTTTISNELGKLCTNSALPRSQQRDKEQQRPNTFSGNDRRRTSLLLV